MGRIGGSSTCKIKFVFFFPHFPPFHFLFSLDLYLGTGFSITTAREKASSTNSHGLVQTEGRTQIPCP